LTRESQFQRYVNGEFIESPEVVVSESNLELWLDDMQLKRFTYTPGFERELGLGNLLTSGLISSKEDLEFVSLNSNQLVLSSRKKTDLVRRFLLMQTSDLQSLGTIPPVSDLSVNVSDLRQAVQLLLSSQNLHDRTGGAHGALIRNLDQSSDIIVEDIGRFNAVDKAVGLALMHDYNLSRCLLIVTGRLTSEMVSKAINARIPIMGSFAIATDLGIHYAMNAKLTLLGRLKNENFWLYNQGNLRLIP